MNPMAWLAMFLYLFALGIAATVSVVPVRSIGSYFFRFHATLTLLLAVVAVLVGKPWGDLVGGPGAVRLVAGGALVFALSVLLENFIVRASGENLRLDALLFPVGLGVTFVLLFAFVRPDYGVENALLLAFHLLTSAALLGTSLVAMTTGHWYLSNAALSFDILRRLTGLFVAAVAAKAIVSGLYLATRFGEYWRLEDFDKLVMGVRLGAGVAFAMLLGLMSLSCAKRRANQSATGILYVAVLFVLIGETISLYLTLRGHRALPL
jgi:hypothetical protein